MHHAWGMGHGAWGMAKLLSLSLPFVLCPLPSALCSMRFALCPMPSALCALVGQHQITRIAEQSVNGPGTGHEKISDNQADKKIAHLFK